MKCEKDQKFLVNRAEKIFEDSLRYPVVMPDERIVEAVKGLLTPEEQECADFSAAVVSGTKIILVCKDPKSLREVIMMERRNPGKVYRRHLSLKRKKNSAQV